MHFRYRQIRPKHDSVQLEIKRNQTFNTNIDYNGSTRKSVAVFFYHVMATDYFILKVAFFTSNGQNKVTENEGVLCMIYVGVTGWGDHDILYPDGIKPSEKLAVYASHFPIVELDACFYAIQPKRNMEKWIKETPDSFQFVVKAYQGMTGHERGESAFTTEEEMYDAFLESLVPLQQANKLAMVLFQFPPWFDLKKEHVNQLRRIKERMGNLPVALEFRHQSWFHPKFKHKTLEFMRTEGWIHVVCDEPQAGEGSIPAVIEATHKQKVLVRFHGRNTYGWNRPKDKNWREVRYLYRYSQKELLEWVSYIRKLEKLTENVYVLFNNNSGGDAAQNAKEMIELLGIQYEQLAPRQLDLFSD